MNEVLLLPRIKGDQSASLHADRKISVMETAQRTQEGVGLVLRAKRKQPVNTQAVVEKVEG